MKIKVSAGEHAFNAVNYVVLFLLMLLMVYPLLYVVLASISEPGKLAMSKGLMFKPQGFSMAAYRAVKNNPMIGSSYLNTLLIVVCGTSINLFMTSLCAFVLSREGMPYKKVMTLFVMFTMFFGGGLIPRYLVVSELGLVDSYLALLLPNAINAYNMIIMRTSFEAVPRSLEESAQIDGANEFVVLLRIILPLSMPVVAVMLLFYGVGHWNNWFSAVVYIRHRSKYPLQLILREILIENEVSSMTTDVGSLDKEAISETIKYATIVVATVPILCIYPFLQKYFAKGVMIGAIKE
jgi:putative aldouronate transport system permease protein